MPTIDTKGHSYDDFFIRY